MSLLCEVIFHVHKSQVTILQLISVCRLEKGHKCMSRKILLGSIKMPESFELLNFLFHCLLGVIKLKGNITDLSKKLKKF